MRTVEVSVLVAINNNNNKVGGGRSFSLRDELVRTKNAAAAIHYGKSID